MENPPKPLKFAPKVALAVCIGMLDDNYKKVAYHLNDKGELKELCHGWCNLKKILAGFFHVVRNLSQSFSVVASWCRAMLENYYVVVSVSLKLILLLELQNTLNKMSFRVKMSSVYLRP